MGNILPTIDEILSAKKKGYKINKKMDPKDSHCGWFLQSPSIHSYHKANWLLAKIACEHLSK
jgi:hypothetical protein